MRRWLHEFRLRLARRLAAVDLHRWMEPTEDETVIRKRRSWFSRFLIPPGNLYLRLMKVDSLVLAETAWHQWEAGISGALIVGRDVVIPRVCGEDLSGILQDPTRSGTEQNKAIRLAMQALRELHSRQVCLNGSAWPLSHGDATVENVRVDLEASTAGWFDFDMQHRHDLGEQARHADDLRAFVFSCAANQRDPHVELFSELIESLCDSETQTMFVTRLLNDWQTPTTFHLAQASLSFEEFHDFRNVLLRWLR